MTFMLKRIRSYEPIPFLWGLCEYSPYHLDTALIAPYPICWIYRWWANQIRTTKIFAWEKTLEKQ